MCESELIHGVSMCVCVCVCVVKEACCGGIQWRLQWSGPQTVSSGGQLCITRSSLYPSTTSFLHPSISSLLPPNPCLKHPDSHLPCLMMSSHYVSGGWLAASPLISYTHTLSPNPYWPALPTTHTHRYTLSEWSVREQELLTQDRHGNKLTCG